MSSNTEPRTPSHSRWRLSAVVIAAIVLLLSSTAQGAVNIPEIHQAPLADLDTRSGTSVAPSGAALSIVSSLGASATWNSFGTPRSLIKHGGFLATGLTGTPVNAAKNWISANKALFKLSTAGVNSLELVNDSKMSGYDGHAVIFRQKFGTLPAAQDGLITVGITGGKIAYVSSSSAGDQVAPGAAVLSPQLAWINAAIDVGRAASLGSISNQRQDKSWTVFDVAGFNQPQRARLVAFPTPTSVRAAFETIVVDVQGGNAIAYTHFVDAQTGQILFRQSKVQQFANMGLLFAPQTTIFTGTYTDDPAPKACGPLHPFTVGAGIFSLDVVASEAVVGNDIVLKLFFGATLVASADTATSPEVIHYEPLGGVPPGVYNVQVCPFATPTTPPQEPYNYVGTFTTNDVAGTPTPAPYPPRWKVFPANPALSLLTDDTRRKVWCWENPVGGTTIAGCDNVHPEKKELFNLAARSPWDYNTRTNTATFTTIGNAANSAEAWGSPLTPAEPYRPIATSRNYTFPWANQWQVQKCNEATAFLPPERNDIDAATVNLFGMHNRMHDWSYFLGFIERNFNAQDNNFGNTAPGPYPTGREFDPEIGNAQAGAISGGPPSYLGRDNANQISLNDGVPPITNMYLWQPIAAAFYAPCVDGDYDMAVIGHEYTHLISNRMVGGPDSNLTGAQAGAMGESWSDLNAVEYLNEYKFVPTNGEHPFSLGAYATGNLERGIRNYNMSRNVAIAGSHGGPPTVLAPQAPLTTLNPLNYSDIGYDITGAQVHADGEIWSATNYDIRQALIAKYNASFPANGATGDVMQRECADGIRPSYLCPGNRRWIQIVYDAWLLMPAGVSMLDARDAYLAADAMRAAAITGPPAWPSNQTELWRVFARRGMGKNVAGTAAFSSSSDDPDPIPSFESPVEGEIGFIFKVVQENGTTPIPGAKVFVGHYEARATPVAVTNAAGLTPAVRFVTGTFFDFIIQAPGYGHLRFTRNAWAGGINNDYTLTIKLPKNLASMTNGAVATGDGVNHDKLIDDTEATNWASLAGPVIGKKVTVDLMNGLQTVKRVQVSAMLRPEDTSAGQVDTGGQNRFTALRQFEILACTAGADVANLTCSNAIDLGFTSIFTSPADAFPGFKPRPAAPDLILREFDVTDTTATHIKLKVLNSQCTGGPQFQGEQDSSLINDTDCDTASPFHPSPANITKVRVAELQVFGSPATAPPADPAVIFTMSAPATVARGGTITYGMSYNNLGPFASANAKVTNVLPTELDFVSATNGGTYNAATRTVTWNLGTVNVGFTGTLQLTTRVKATVLAGTVITNNANYTADLTAATPAAAVTAVTP